MKTKKITVVSLILAATLVIGTVTVFATSAKTETDKPATAKSNALPSEMVEAVESGDAMKPSAEYIAAGITAQDNPWSNNSWYYQKKPIAGIYDDNGDIYMNNSVDTDGIYLNVDRDDKDQISKVSVVTKEQFLELVDRHMNANPPASTLDNSTLMSYVNPDDGKTYYSFDDGKTFEPLTDAEFEARFPTPNVEWWTYDEYKAWLENEKVQLQSLLGETGSVNGQKFTWTQEKIDETIAMYEEILNDIKNGIMYSKSVDGEEDQMVSYDPTDIATATETA